MNNERFEAFLLDIEKKVPSFKHTCNWKNYSANEDKYCFEYPDTFQQSNITTIILLLFIEKCLKHHQDIPKRNSFFFDDKAYPHHICIQPTRKKSVQFDFKKESSCITVKLDRYILIYNSEHPTLWHSLFIKFTVLLHDLISLKQSMRMTFQEDEDTFLIDDEYFFFLKHLLSTTTHVDCADCSMLLRNVILLNKKYTQLAIVKNTQMYQRVIRNYDKELRIQKVIAK